MAKSQETFNKKEKEKKRQKKRQEKMMRKEERKNNSNRGDFDSMIAYVDEFGNIVDTPVDPAEKTEIKAEDINVSGVGRNFEGEEADEVQTGRVDYYNTDKGYGFIKATVGREKYFFHINGVIDEVKERDMVSFELEQSQRGMNAVKVKKILG